MIGKKKLVLLLASFLLLNLAGCATHRITDENLNKIALCTGGIGNSFGIDSKIQAGIDREQKNLAGSAKVNYEEIVSGIILSDHNLSDDMKKFYYDRYLTCLRQLALAPESHPNMYFNSPNGVISVNQQGGISANTVNIGPQARAITPQFELELRKVVSGFEKITITSVLGDGEAFQFATAIKTYLTDHGYNVYGINQAVYSGPISGQIAKPSGNTLELIIGSNK